MVAGFLQIHRLIGVHGSQVIDFIINIKQVTDILQTYTDCVRVCVQAHEYSHVYVLLYIHERAEYLIRISNRLETLPGCTARGWIYFALPVIQSNAAPRILISFHQAAPKTNIKHSHKQELEQKVSERRWKNDIYVHVHLWTCT